MTINIKLEEGAVAPRKSSDNAAAFDLFCRDARFYTEKTGDLLVEYDTGVSFEIPDGYVGILAPRSSVSTKGMLLANSIGVIDPDYRGVVKARFYYHTDSESYNIGDRVAQIMFIEAPKVTLNEVTKLSETTRGSGGFGSTGN